MRLFNKARQSCSSNMKNQTLIIVAFLVVFGFFGAEAVGGYTYCGQPCNDPSGMVCGYNQNCYNIFINSCALKTSNCDMGTTFNQYPMSHCLMGKKC